MPPRGSPAGVTLVVPGLHNPPQAVPADAPALRFLLQRGKRRQVSLAPLVAVARALGFDYGEAADIPAGAFSWLAGFGTLPDRPVMQAALVHLRADLDRLLLYAGGPLRITTDERDALIDTFNHYFAERGVALRTGPAQQLWLEYVGLPAIRPAPLDQVLGRSLADVLPGGEGASAWSAFLNELQMLFFDHPVNRARERAGLPAINGLWCWGGGEPGPAGLPCYDKVWSEVAVVRGMAVHAGVEQADLPLSPSSLAQGDVGRHLVWLGRLVEPAAYRDETAWRAGLVAIESEWLAPLMSMLRRGRIGWLELQPGEGTARRCSRWRALLFRRNAAPGDGT